jgi:glutaredoxin 3
MEEIKIYTLDSCMFCKMAKQLLDSKNVKYHEISIDNNDDARQQMIDLTGKTSVPQIFFGAQYIGGCDDLQDLDAAGKLDKLLENFK